MASRLGTDGEEGVEGRCGSFRHEFRVPVGFIIYWVLSISLPRVGNDTCLSRSHEPKITSKDRGGSL